MHLIATIKDALIRTHSELSACDVQPYCGFSCRRTHRNVVLSGRANTNALTNAVRQKDKHAPVKAEINCSPMTAAQTCCYFPLTYETLHSRPTPSFHTHSRHWMLTCGNSQKALLRPFRVRRVAFHRSAQLATLPGRDLVMRWKSKVFNLLLFTACSHVCENGVFGLVTA